MNVIKLFCVLVLATSILSCTPDNLLTQEEVENQNRSSQVVTDVLFENDADEAASYNVRNDGYVVIQFDSSVSEKKYTRIVNQLRSSSNIPGVWAEQDGVEVCPLR
jgi:hypothetical protein